MKELSECRILIVDDVPASVQILVQALRGQYQLSVATDGKSALAATEGTLPDLVLLDIVMPGMDGYEVCRLLRASPRTRDIPVMFLSSLEDVQDKNKGFEVGGNDYLVKPFHILEVKARVKSLLRAKAYADAVKEEIACELRIASEIQMGILTQDIASVIQGTGLEAHATLHPAKEVGGDLYELLRMPDGNLVAVMGDVSGKGIAAALFMAVTTALVRALSPGSGSPEELLRRVNDALASHNPHTMFVSLLCAFYNPQTGRLSYASAGHPPPVLLREGTARFLPLVPASVAAITEGLCAPCHCVELQPGDVVVLYTDGVTEAMDAGDRLYGEAKLLEELAGQSGRGAGAVTEALIGSVRTHAAQRPQSDDITVMTLRKTP